MPCDVPGFVVAVDTGLVCICATIGGAGPCAIGGAFEDAGTSASKVLLFATA